MHYLKKINSLGKDVDIALYQPSDIENISLDEWEKLQKKSRFKNPFFEYWNLIPALKNLTNKNDSIFIVTLYSEKTLVGLFPVIRTYRCKIIPTCSVWQHRHCFLSTPLLSIDVNFDEIMINISDLLNCYWSYIPLHERNLIHSVNSTHIFSSPYSRAAIHNTNSITQNIKILKGKQKREINREKTKLESLGDIKFIKYQSKKSGLSDFSQLEAKGWKGRNGGAIINNPSVSQYYQDIFSNHDENIDVFGLFKKNELLAITIRLKTNNTFFEIKTTYNENMKRFAPGKIMEIYLLEELSSHRDTYVDSCTNQDNKFLNWLWPDEKKLYITYIFSNNALSNLLNIIYLFKHWLRK